GPGSGGRGGGDRPRPRGGPRSESRTAPGRGTPRSLTPFCYTADRIVPEDDSMSATDTPVTAPGDKTYEEVRAAWRAANIRPLWENPLAHNTRDGGPRPHLWKWDVLRPAVAEALQVTSPAAGARPGGGGGGWQVVDREANSRRAGTTTNIAANLQVLRPGGSARPHRHTMNALRFVVEGKGAYTIVDGKSCLMEEGDLVITPGWTWH